MTPDVAIGFVLSGCIPAGGAGAPAAVMCFLLRGEPPLCVALMFASTLVGVITAPALLIIFLPYVVDDTYIATLQRDDDAKDADPSDYTFTIFRNLAIMVSLVNLCLFLIMLLAQAFRRAARKVAEFIENWMLEPVLLCSGILFTTMGVPINMYIFSNKNYYILGASVIQILIAYLAGVSTALVTCINSLCARTLTSSFCAVNVLPTILLLRWVLEPSIFPSGFFVAGSPPDGDLGVIGPAWILVAYPLPLILHYSNRALRRWFVAFVRKRREEQYRY